jgi:hypothetical protein
MEGVCKGIDGFFRERNMMFKEQSTCLQSQVEE